MALTKSQDLSSVLGINATTNQYASVAGGSMIRINGEFRVTAVVEIYANQQAYQDGKKPIASHTIMVPNYQSDAPYNIHTMVYTYLKTLPEFSDWQDA